MFKRPRIGFPLSALDIKGINDFFEGVMYKLFGNIDFADLGANLKDRIKKTESKITVAEQEINGINASIELIDGQVELKVSKDNIINEINLSTEGILISAGKVDINGVVRFTDLATPGATTIHGGNIITDTISFNALKDKPSIPVLPGYIQSTKITSTTIESPTITGNNLAVNSTLKLKPPSDLSNPFSSSAWLQFYKDQTQSIDIYYALSSGLTINAPVQTNGIYCVGNITNSVGGGGQLDLNRLDTQQLYINGSLFDPANIPVVPKFA